MTRKHRLPWQGTSLDQQILDVEQRLALRKLSAHFKAQAMEQRLRSTLGSPTSLLLAAGVGFLLGRIRPKNGVTGGAADCAATTTGPSITGDVVRALILAFVR